MPDDSTPVAPTPRSRETLFWTALLVLGALGLLGRAMFTTQGMGREYVKQAPTVAGQANVRFEAATYREFAAGQAQLSQARTVGLWISAFLTLAVFSFLYKDNVFYRLAESIFVGISAAYWMVYAFWSTIIPTLVARLSPTLVKDTFMPGLEIEQDLIFLIPLGLGIMLLWRLSPVGGWIARWPLAFIVGTTAGIRLVGFLQADFLSQIVSTIQPLITRSAQTGSIDPWGSLGNTLLVIGVLSGLVYFFFSIEHKGPVGAVARVGIWFMMITFGAAFGYTVMGRIALLAARLEFLLDDWLWLIDPGANRVLGP
ncbi:MAG: hypothetical protein U0836_00480 [Pirellulales bacterium]